MNTRKILPCIIFSLLAGCAHAPGPKTSPVQAPAQDTAKKPAPVRPVTPPSQAMLSDAEFSSCVKELSIKAKAAGISSATITANLSKARYNKRVIELDRKQPEFSTTFADYFNRSVSEQRITQGKALLIKHKDLLDRVTQKYGVPAPYILAFWGLETNFGRIFGDIPVVDSLTTLACDPRRPDFFTSELMSALSILDAGDVAPNQMIGSWAGAMGNFQFMPSALIQNAIDYDGDKKRDLWKSTPDAIASAAKYLQNLGWQANSRWGREVKLPTGFPFQEAGLKNTRTLAEWKKLGVKTADNQALPQENIKASLLVPSGYRGPAFLVYENFNVIMRWNRAEFYALAVGHLADRIAGAGPLVQPPPTDEPRLRFEQIWTLQEQLNKKGFDAGAPDGIFGPGTRRALSQYQHQQGMIADGFPSKKLLETLGVNTGE
jgi:membrane-bound lytic murein transglycosylase B